MNKYKTCNLILFPIIAIDAYCDKNLRIRNYAIETIKEYIKQLMKYMEVK